MKKQLIILSGAIVLALGACNDSTTTTTPATAPGDTTIQKTTTTTTTTTTVHPIANFEHRTFMSVKTGKPVKLRVDTIHHYYVEMETNQQPDYYYFDPVAHDTFDYRGRLLNNALIFNNGNYSIDESRIMDSNNGSTGTTDMENNDNSGTSTSTTDHTGKSKIKQKEDMYKEKTDNSKIKITDDKMKIKTK